MSWDNGLHCIFLPKEGPFRVDSPVYCGREGNGFISNLSHAEGCLARDSYVQPCKRCLRLARKAPPCQHEWIPDQHPIEGVTPYPECKFCKELNN